jgi:hypothetical protein
VIRRTTLLVLLLAIGHARGAAGQSPAPLDACALMLKADADAAFAPRVFIEDAKAPGGFAGTAKLATVASCTYSSRGASLRDLLTVGILVRRAPNDKTGVTVAAAKDGAIKLNKTPVDVPGLGDAAYWVDLGSARRPVVSLNVFKGKRLWLVFSASAAGLNTETALVSLKTVAKATLARL